DRKARASARCVDASPSGQGPASFFSRTSMPSVRNSAMSARLYTLPPVGSSRSQVTKPRRAALRVRPTAVSVLPAVGISIESLRIPGPSVGMLAQRHIQLGEATVGKRCRDSLRYEPRHSLSGGECASKLRMLIEVAVIEVTQRMTQHIGGLADVDNDEFGAGRPAPQRQL